jgi:hypothetical protein
MRRQPRVQAAWQPRCTSGQKRFSSKLCLAPCLAGRHSLPGRQPLDREYKSRAAGRRTNIRRAAAFLALHEFRLGARQNQRREGRCPAHYTTITVPQCYGRCWAPPSQHPRNAFMCVWLPCGQMLQHGQNSAAAVLPDAHAPGMGVTAVSTPLARQRANSIVYPATPQAIAPQGAWQ